MSCKIIVSNPGIIGVGDIVTGKVICTFDEEEHIRGIKCIFRGREETHWSEKRGKHTTYYKSENDLVVADSNFAGEGSMSPGVYEYPFAYALPPSNIPGSFNHQFGSIRYFIKAHVDKPFAFDYKDEVTLHVVAPITFDTNQNQQTMNLTYQAEKEVGSCCCVGDPVAVNLILEKDTYVPGEIVNFTVHVENTSDVPIVKMKVEIAINIQFTAHRPNTRHKDEKTIVALAEDMGVAERDARTYNFSLKLPESTIIPSFLGCGLFKSWCTVGAEAVLPTCHRNLHIQANIHLSNVHFRVNGTPAGSRNNLAQATTGDYLPTAPLCEDGNLIDAKDNERPPSYNEAMERQNLW